MHRITKIALIFASCIILIAVGIYMRYTVFAPTLQEVKDVQTFNKGTIEYVSQGIVYKEATYVTQPDHPTIKPVKKGKFVGKTKRGLQIYQVENHNDQLVATGFMFPDEVYTKADSIKKTP